MEPPPLPYFENQYQKDDEHLKLLAVFHFIIGGLSILMIGFVVLHFLVMKQVFMNPEIWKGKSGAGHGPPAEIFQAFTWFYIAGGMICLLAGIGNVLSGWFLQRKQHRTFSLIVAGANCLHMPFGTVLGVFTLLVLLRESVRQSYENTVTARGGF